MSRVCIIPGHKDVGRKSHEFPEYKKTTEVFGKGYTVQGTEHNE